MRDSDPCHRSARGELRPASLVVGLVLVALAGPLSMAKDKPKSNDPYATAEQETPPAVKAEDLGVRVILFEQFDLPPEYAKDGAKDVGYTRSEAISRLTRTGAFTRVGEGDAPAAGGPYFRVKAVLVDHKIVSGTGRFFGGAMAGSSRLAYWVKLLSGADGALIDEFCLSTEGGAWSGGFTGGATDRDLPFFLGRVLGDYLALRARKDEGLSIAPIWKGSAMPDLTLYRDPATQLTWAAKDNRETVTWDRAVEYAKAFRGGDLSDWRLPTESELITLYKAGNPSTVLGETVRCSDQVRLSSYQVWTGEGQGDQATAFDFRKGKASSKKKADYTKMRALVVRK
jgi:uncharacterized protein DUF1566